MALTTDKNKIIYQLDGTSTTFAFDFPIIKDTDLQVWVYDTSGNKTLLTLNTDYTVTTTDTSNSDYILATTTGGTVTLNNAYETGYTLLIYREVPYTQDTVYPENSPFPAKSHEKALDKLTMETQQLHEKVERALLKDTVTGLIDLTNVQGLDNYMQKTVYDTNKDGYVDATEYFVFTYQVVQQDTAKYSPVAVDGTIVDSSNVLQRNRLLGFALENGTSGSAIKVLTSGKLSDPNFSFTANAILYINGTDISDTPPTTGFIQVVGKAINANTIVIKIEPAIKL